MSTRPSLSTRTLAAYAAPGLGLSLLISPFPAIITDKSLIMRLQVEKSLS